MHYFLYYRQVEICTIFYITDRFYKGILRQPRCLHQCYRQIEIYTIFYITPGRDMHYFLYYRQVEICTIFYITDRFYKGIRRQPRCLHQCYRQIEICTIFYITPGRDMHYFLYYRQALLRHSLTAQMPSPVASVRWNES